MKKVLLRLFISLLAACCVGGAVHWTLLKLNHPDGSPAGFGRGILHGALMPMALPNLLVGDDVSIYAANNTGRLYKVGYIAGVNVCGLAFFGYLFWRARALRRDLKQVR